MSTPAAPAAAPAATDAPPANPNIHLPDGVKVDASHSADAFFPDGRTPDSAPPPKPDPANPGAAAAAPPAKADPKAPVSAVASKLLKKELVAAPKPDAAPVENPEDKLALDDKAHAHTRTTFDKLKGITKGLRDQVIAREEEAKKLKGQLEALPKITGDTSPEEVIRLRQEHKAFSERLMLLDLKNHPDFQRQYLLPKSEALGAAGELLKAANITVDVAQLVNLPRAEFGKAVSDAAAKLPTFDQIDFAENMRKAYALSQGEREAMGKAEGTLQSIRQQNQQRNVTTFNRVWGKVSAQTGEHLVKLDIPDGAAADEKTAIESYNAAIGSLQENAQRIATGQLGEEEIAAAAIKAAAYDLHTGHVMPRLLADYEKLAAYANELHGELQALRGRNPNRDQVHGGDPGNGPKPEEMSHGEAADHFYSRQGQTGR